MPRTLINPPATQPLYEQMHFSQGVRVGDTLWFSGQVGIDERFHPGDGIEAQARLAFENLKRVLAAAGASLADVVELTTYHTDLRGEMEAFGQVKDEYLPADYPAWTAIGVSQLALEALRVEIRAVAVVGSAIS